MRSELRGLPMVAVVGRPNVGKSSLVNRISGGREAIVEATPGVTRDRRSLLAEWRGRRFDVVDTGGLDPAPEGIEIRVAEQAHLAIEAADVVVLVVDVTTGPLEDDLLVADILRRANKRVIVAVNKVDASDQESAAADFYRLGLGEPRPVSALHGRRTGDFLDVLVAELPPEKAAVSDAWAAATIVGRPNVGKSSLLNTLLGETRSIVDPRPGTTRDPVDTYLALDGDRVLKLVDTAGLRREVRIKESIEYFGLLRSRRALGRSDAAILVIDVSEGVTGSDQRIAQEIVQAGRACVIALNKWDLVDPEEAEMERLERSIQDRLRFLEWGTVVRTSAVTGRAVERLLPAVTKAVDSHRTRLATALVNQIVQTAQDDRPHPRTGGRSTRVLYAVQAGVGPPRFLLFTNGSLDRAYVRYLERRIREVEPFGGTPLVLETRVKARRKLKS